MPHPGAEGGYALDFISPMRHVATELAGAGAAGLRLTDIQRTYTYHLSGDFHRIRLHELHDPQASDEQAKRWLIARAVKEFGEQITTGEDGLLRLAVPVEELRGWAGQPITLEHDPHERFNNPFDPMTTTGEFARNIRDARSKDDTSDLESSMRSFGWLEELPAITDERGVVLTGHRRLEVAKKLGIQPRIERRTYGDNDLGTVNRAIVAFASNVGQKPFTAADRRKIAKRLYTEEQLSQTEIASRLKVSQGQISADLKGVISSDNPHPERGGRPRKQPKPSKVAHRDVKVAEMSAAGAPMAEIEAATGVSIKNQYNARLVGTAHIVDSLGGIEHVREVVQQNGTLPEGETCPTCHGTGRI